MGLNLKKLLLYAIWVILIALSLFSALRVTPYSTFSGNLTLLVNFLQRVTALAAFGLLFFQIILGAYMTRFTEKLGGWVFRFHVIQGTLTYALVIGHPILFVFFNFRAKGVLDPFYVFTEICVLCNSVQEIWYTLGRVAFWLITLSAIAGLLRKEAWWRVHWRKFHIANYFVFFLVAIHAWFSGTDAALTPFVWFFWIAIVGVLATIIHMYFLPYLTKLKTR